jgi:transcriptional regulator with XRE-family HTH domain
LEIKDRLRAARTAIGKTQEQVASEAGMNITQYNGYERGRSRPSLATLERLASALDATVPELSGEIPPPSEPLAEATTQSVLSERIDAFRRQISVELNFPLDRISVNISLR